MHHFLNLLDTKTILSFGEPHKDSIKRETIVAVIYEPASKKYLCQYWEEYNGLTCLLSGGVEAGEDANSALIREIAEETGHINFTVLGTLGGKIHSHYYKQNTDEYFVKSITPYLVLLNSRRRDKEAKEADENFENLFRTPKEIIKMMSDYETLSGSTLADHKTILDRGVKYIESKELT